MLKISGSNFRVPPDPPAGLTDGIEQQTVSVTIGGVPAREVKVRSSSLVTAVTPIHDPGAVDVVVQNLDDDGVDISGESATRSGAFTFERPRLSPDGDETNESSLAFLVRTLILELKRQVIEEVALTSNTDYDEDSGAQLHTTVLPKLPGIVLVGPMLRENRFYSENEPPAIDEAAPVDDGDFVVVRPPYTVDVVFSIVGISDSMVELLNLMSATTLFFDRNDVLGMPIDVGDPSLGNADYEMQLEPEGDMRVSGSANNSNVRSFTGRFAIRGLDIETFEIPSGYDGVVAKHAIVDVGKTLDTVDLDVGQSGQ